MRNEKKIALLTQRLSNLENENSALRLENQTLLDQLNDNKNTILSREQILDEKERQLEDSIRNYTNIITELKQAKEAYECAVEVAKEAKSKYETEIKKLLKRLKKQK